MKKVTQSRYFPTLSVPLLAGLVGSGIVVILHLVGATSVVPSDVNNAVAPLVGFIITAITAKPQAGDMPGPTPAVKQKTVGSQIGELVSMQVHSAVDQNPTLVHDLVKNLVAALPPPEAQVVESVAAALPQTGAASVR